MEERERDITFLWKEHSRPFLWDPRSCDQLSRRYARNSISPTCSPSLWYLAPSSMRRQKKKKKKKKTGCKTCGTQGTREPSSTVSPTPMEPMEEETSEYARMGKPILDEVITCVLATWGGEEREGKSLHYVKRGSARFLSKAREASLYHQEKKKEKIGGKLEEYS